MASATLTLPNGVTFRTATQRRFIVVNARSGAATIVKRSDELATVQQEYARHVDTVQSGDSAKRSRWYIVDTVTGETIAQRADDDFQYVY